MFPHRIPPFKLIIIGTTSYTLNTLNRAILNVVKSVFVVESLITLEVTIEVQLLHLEFYVPVDILETVLLLAVVAKFVSFLLKPLVSAFLAGGLFAVGTLGRFPRNAQTDSTEKGLEICGIYGALIQL